MNAMPCVGRYTSSFEYSWSGPLYSGGWNLYMYTSVLGEWETYVGKLAQHYAGDIGNYELWNEPTMAWPSSVTSVQYVTLLKDTRPYMVAQDANAKIVGFGGVDTNYMSQVLSYNTAQYMDRVSDHPYAQLWRPEVFLPPRVTRVRAVMTAGGCPTSMAIWDTEQGIYADGDGYKVPAFTEADVAQLYTRNVVTAKSAGVGKYFWFAAHSSQCYGFGIYYADHIPRPRLMALNACASFTEGLTWQTLYTFNAATYAAHVQQRHLRSGDRVVQVRAGDHHVTDEPESPVGLRHERQRDYDHRLQHVDDQPAGAASGLHPLRGGELQCAEYGRNRNDANQYGGGRINNPWHNDYRDRDQSICATRSTESSA